MAENVANDVATTLGASIVDGSTTSITVSSGSGFPSPNFRIRIDNELMLVTSVGGGTNWTVTRAVEGTSGVSHSNSATVTHVLTAAAVDNIVKERTSGRNAIWVPAAAMGPWASNPATYSQGGWTNQPNRLWYFDASTAQYVHFQLGAPKRWNMGTITYKVMWLPGDSSANSVVWALQGASMGEGDSYDPAMGTAISVTDGVGSSQVVRLSAESSALTIAGTPQEDDFLNFRLYRDAANGSDTATTVAYVFGVWLYFTTTAPTDA